MSGDPVVLLIISVAACLLYGIFNKIYVRRVTPNNTSREFYNVITSFVCMVILMLQGGIGNVSFFTVWLGALFGIVSALQNRFRLKAMDLGPWSYTTVITSLSMLIPSLSGYFFWDEHISVVQLIGIAMMVVCFILSTDSGSDQSREKKSVSIKWLIFCGLCFLCTGSVGLMQKIHQTSVYASQLNGFLVIAFIFSTVWSLVLCILSAKKEGIPSSSIRLPLLLLMIAGAGVCGTINNKFNLYLSGVMDSAVLYPILNGGNLVLTTIASVVIFHEKLSKKQWIGLVIGTISVLLLCDPFA